MTRYELTALGGTSSTSPSPNSTMPPPGPMAPQSVHPSSSLNLIGTVCLPSWPDTVRKPVPRGPGWRKQPLSSATIRKGRG
jgi:hypothetical protein